MTARAREYESQGLAVYASFAKHCQDLPETIRWFQSRSRLHTSCASLYAENRNSIEDGSKPKEASESIDETTQMSSNANSSGSEKSHPEARNPVSWLSLSLMLLTGAGLMFYYDLEKQRRLNASQQTFSLSNTSSPGEGKATIGGPFKLTDHEGKEITDDRLKGNWTLVYFGFTHCPDICPDELQKMVEAIDVIEKRDNIQITPVFISVDPERDSVEQIREYVKEFHPRLIGLTGRPEEIKQVARAYRVYYMKTGEEDADYLVDHSIIIYLMDPNMEFVKFFGKNYDVSGLVDGIVEQIKDHKA